MTFNFDNLVPEGLSLLPHQTTGVATALIERRVIIGDEMGVGKTLSALIATEAADAYPSVIVCPASLQANWVNEINKFLPHRETFIALGKPGGRGADITVISYNQLHQWLEQFHGTNTVVLDEGHYANNPMRRRTRAALSLTSWVPEEGLVMSLTGTPFVNKPIELTSQLRLIDRLRPLTPPPEAVNDERAWTKSFSEYWCQTIPDLRGLHRALSQTCYIRRQRKDVLGRNDTLPKEVWLSLQLTEYREAEADLISYLTERNGGAVAARAANATGLAKLAHLRRLVGEAKTWAAQQWVNNFLLTNPERSLVIFAYHQEVQRALAAHYNCPHIFGGENDVEAEKHAFQSGAHRLIVVSLTAGKEGHNLTKASDVLFVELPWTPGALDQAAARINRIGQIADDTYAWFLLGAGTIDRRAWDIIEAKRALFKAGAEGQGGQEIEHAIATEILDGYRLSQPRPHIDHALREATIIPIRKGA